MNIHAGTNPLRQGIKIAKVTGFEINTRMFHEIFSSSNNKRSHIGVLVKLMNRITEGHIVPPQHVMKELKRLLPSGQPEAPMAGVIRGSR